MAKLNSWWHRRLIQPIRIKVDKWFDARVKNQGDSIVLTNRNTYVIPTRFGYILAFVLFGLLLAAMNYSNSMAFMLTFLLAGIAILGMHYTYGTLVRLKIEVAQSSPVFAEQSAKIPLLLTAINQTSRYGIFLGNADELQVPSNVEQARTRIYYQTEALERGRYRLPRTRIWTTFPFGLFFSWAWLRLNADVLVYPKPQSFLDQIASSNAHIGEQSSDKKGDDDFAGIRRYQETDSPNRIAWKALAHSQEMLSKDFSGTVDNQLWLDYDSLSMLEPEQRLSQLCQWILDCEREHQPYGLTLPNIEIDIDLGERHKNACLEQLALFEVVA